MMTRKQTTRIRPARGWLLPALGALGLAYLAWSRADRAPPPAPAGGPIRRREIGVDAGRGNLLGLQPRLFPADYASAGQFHARLDRYFAAAAGLLTPRTVVVLPEYLGTWLCFAGEKAGVFRAGSLAGALGLTAAGNLPALPWPLLHSHEAQRLAAALIRLKATQAAAIYHRVMSALARRYAVHVVAGSILLPAPRVSGGTLHAGDGPLYNTAVLYRPDGAAVDPPVRKCCPTAEEEPLLAPGSDEALPVFDTPAGRLGVLICADAWFPAPYDRLRAQGVELIAVPSYSVHDPAEPWTGYSGAPAPPDVNPGDVGRLTRADAWRTYALAGRIARSGARAGINVFLFGALWGMCARGEAAAVRADRAMCIPADDGIGLVNLWL